MKISFCILTILLYGITSCQDIDPLVVSIAKENRVECQRISVSGEKSQLYKKFKKLKNRSSKNELIKLMDHDSFAVIGYSSYALIDRKLVEPDKLLQRFINKKDKVLTFCGCTLDTITLSSLIYHRYWRSRIKYLDDRNYDKYEISDSKELQRMDSLILYAKSPDATLLSSIFENRIFSIDYKSKIEEWAFNKNNIHALKYVYKNLSFGNEKKLELALDEYLKGENAIRIQEKEIIKMLNDIKKES